MRSPARRSRASEDLFPRVLPSSPPLSRAKDHVDARDTWDHRPPPRVTRRVMMGEGDGREPPREGGEVRQRRLGQATDLVRAPRERARRRIPCWTLDAPEDLVAARPRPRARMPLCGGATLAPSPLAVPVECVAPQALAGVIDAHAATHRARPARPRAVRLAPARPLRRTFGDRDSRYTPSH